MNKEEEAGFLERVDGITNQLMDVIREYVGYSCENDSEDVVEVLYASREVKVSTPAEDLDDLLYHHLHQVVQRILREESL